MAKLLHRLGSFSTHRRGWVVLTWLMVLVLSGAGALTLSGPTNDDFEIPGQESIEALHIMEDRLGPAASGATAQVVLQARNGRPITDASNAAAVGTVAEQLRRSTGATSVTNPLAPESTVISPDASTTYIGVTFAVPPTELEAGQHDALDDALETGRDVGLTAEMTGDATQVTEQHASEAVGVIVAFVILTLTFGSLLAAGMNMLTALVGVGIGTLGIMTATGFADLSSTTPALASMLGLAVGIDYALFIVTRFRHQLRAGDSVNEAAALATGTAGSAVVTAGLTVVIALIGLTLSGIPFLGQMGLAAAATVVIAVLVAVTLVPAVLSFAGNRLLPKKQRGLPPTNEQEPPVLVSKWASLVTSHPWKVLVATVVVLGAIALPAASLQTSLALRPADGSTQEKATQLLNTAFGPGSTGPLLILLDGPGASERATEVAAEAQSVSGVVAAAPSIVLPDGVTALVSVVPASSPESAQTVSIVQELRQRLARDSGPEAYVTGQTAVSVDVSQQLEDALPAYLAVVVGLAFVLLILVFRSIAVPLVGVLGFLLTIGASFGVMVAVFQWGWLASVVEPGTPGPVLSFAPILVIGILFGLAMDYQVFLVSRMHEAHAHGANARDAVIRGFRHSASVVLVAAAIMFGVFAGFITGDPTIKQIALTLACGIAFDAVLVRMLAVPAVLTLLGKHAWSFPSWLRWLPTLDVEGRELERR